MARVGIRGLRCLRKISSFSEMRGLRSLRKNWEQPMSTATITEPSNETIAATDRLTKALKQKLSHPATSPDIDLQECVNGVLADIDMTTDDSGGELSFYGQDPILPSHVRLGPMAAVGLAARSVALAALWRQTTGEGQNISVDVRKALRRFA